MAYENLTFESILQRALSRADVSQDKREGSPLYNALAPSAAEHKEMYLQLDVILNETFAETASREFLIKRAKERGLSPLSATHAVFRGIFNQAVPIGARFSKGDFIYQVTENISGFNYKVISESVGSEANVTLGNLIPVDYIEGLTSAQLVELLVPGRDEEDTESFRKRYFSSFNTKAFSGNRADYIEKVNAIPGVGGCKVYRTPSGGGSVGIVLIDGTFGVPSMTLINDVQSHMDPIDSNGDGVGLAPIGHSVLISGVTEVIINVSSMISYAPGWNFDAVKPYVESAIDEYFLELRKGWADETQVIVRIAQIESRILKLAGVVDVGNTLLNGGTANLVLSANQIPIRGSLNG